MDHLAECLRGFEIYSERIEEERSLQPVKPTFRLSSMCRNRKERKKMKTKKKEIASWDRVFLFYGIITVLPFALIGLLLLADLLVDIPRWIWESKEGQSDER
jgi:hypothetical protein